MGEYIIWWDGIGATLSDMLRDRVPLVLWPKRIRQERLREHIVRCRDCKHLDIPEWDNTLAMIYGEPPTFCMNLSQNEWRMDGDRRVVETSFLEVSPDGFCAWGKRKEVGE